MIQIIFHSLGKYPSCYHCRIPAYHIILTIILVTPLSNLLRNTWYFYGNSTLTFEKYRLYHKLLVSFWLISLKDIYRSMVTMCLSWNSRNPAVCRAERYVPFSLLSGHVSYVSYRKCSVFCEGK